MGEWNVFNIKPFISPSFGIFLWGPDWVPCPSYSPYFGTAYLKYGSLPEVRGKREVLLPLVKMGFTTQEYLAQGYKARNVQYGPRGEVVDLGPIEL